MGIISTEEKDQIKEVLRNDFKAKGLDITEEALIAVTKVAFTAIPKILKITANPFDDMLIPVIKIAEPKVIEFLDKIDGEDDYPALENA